MITPERLEFIEDARQYSLTDLKYNIDPDFYGMGSIAILYNLWKLEDWDKLTPKQLKYVQSVIKCLEKDICVPEITEPLVSYLLTEDSDPVMKEKTCIGGSCKIMRL